MEYDVFISYSSRDAAWVRGELRPLLEQAGVRVCVDYHDFKPGKQSIHEMNRAVMTSRWTLLVLTPDYLSSEFCEYESVLGEKFDRLLPLLLEDCQPPERIAKIVRIDYTDDADIELARKQLLTALGAAPDPVPAAPPTRESWLLAHPYAMPPDFTGRNAERAMLAEWLTADSTHPLLELRALGGFGKSALAWQWLLHDVDPLHWPLVVWWSFYDANAGFDSFLAAVHRYLGEPPAPPRQQLDDVLQTLRARDVLLVLDGFERALRAFGGIDAAYQGDSDTGGERDCMSPLAEAFLRGVATLPGLRGKVLMTTRLRPAPLETHGGVLLHGCREEQLLQLQPADAVEFFHARGIRGQRAEIEAACAPYGYHPLSLGILAGWIVGDLHQPGDIAAAQRLDVSGDLVQRQHHVLQQSYDSLGGAPRTLLDRLLRRGTPLTSRQKLLSRIACFRSPVPYETLQELADDRETLEADLRDLVSRGLLQRDAAAGRFDLHPIVRRYAYDRLAAPDRTRAHKQLRDYFAAVPERGDARSVDELMPVIELYHHTVRAGQYDAAWRLFEARLKTDLYYRLGEYRLIAELLRALFPDGEDQPPRLTRPIEQTAALDTLANCYSLTGQPARAMPLFEREVAIEEQISSGSGIAVSWVNLSADQLRVGRIKAAEENLRATVALCQRLRHEYPEAVGHCELGELLAERGAWAEADKELSTSLEMFTRMEQEVGLAILWDVCARGSMLKIRSALVTSNADHADPQWPIAAARTSLQWAGRIEKPEEFLYVNGYCRLGAAQLLAGEFEEADRSLTEALQRARRKDMVTDEAEILVELARLRFATGTADEGRRFAENALLITERCGYVLQGADAHLVLAKWTQSRAHAEQALRLATCDGPPDFTYKAAYDEATALLAR